MSALQAGSRPRRPPIRRFVELAEAGDFVQTTALALDFAATNSRLSVITDLFHAAQRYVEDRWHVGSATARDEYQVHRAVETAMASLPEPTRRRTYEPAPRAALATLWPEEHDLGLRLVAAALSDEGWLVDIELGIRVHELTDMAVRRKPDIVLISATYVAGHVRANLATAVLDIHRLGLPIMAGGSAFSRYPLLGEQLGFDVVADDARLAVMHAARLVSIDQRRLDSSAPKAS